MKNKKHKKTKITLGVIVLIILLLIALRAYLPIWAKDYVNEALNDIDGYSGGVEDVDINLWRGAYSIQNLILNKDGNNVKKEFLNIDNIDLSIQWGALLDGRIVSEVSLDNARANFIVSDDAALQTGTDVDWTKPIEELMPIDINIVKFNGGKISYLDYSTSPDINLYIADISGEITNLRNVKDRAQALPSKLNITGNSIGGGSMNISGGLNILKQIPDFDINAELENVNLPAINDFARKHAGLDFTEGNLNIYSEFVIKDGNIVGYVKPLATNIDVVSLEQDTGPLEILWESIASVIIEIFKNQSKDQFGGKIPISGSLKGIDANGWATFTSILHNAFVRAFEKDTDGSIRFFGVESSAEEDDDVEEEKKDEDEVKNDVVPRATTEEYLGQ